MDVPPIEQMPNLSKRLGESGMDRIRYAGRANTARQPNATNIENNVFLSMQSYRANSLHCPVHELITAAAHFDGHQHKPLNINRIFNIVQLMEVINTREIIKMTGLGERQAQKYLRAVKFIMPRLENHFRSSADAESEALSIRDSEIPALTI